MRDVYYSKEELQEKSYKLILPWVSFLKSVENGYEILSMFKEELTFKPDSDSIGSYNFFYYAFAPKFAEDKKLRSNLNVVVSSVRNAFLDLLPKEVVEDLGYTKPVEITQEDIENAKFLVDRSDYLLEEYYLKPFLGRVSRGERL